MHTRTCMHTHTRTAQPYMFMCMHICTRACARARVHAYVSVADISCQATLESAPESGAPLVGAGVGRAASSCASAAVMDELLSVAFLGTLRTHETGEPLMKLGAKLSVADIAAHEVTLHHLVRYYPTTSMLPANIRDGLVKLDSKLKISGAKDNMEQLHWCTIRATFISSLKTQCALYAERASAIPCR